MPTVHLSMKKLKEILRLKYDSGLSHRQIAQSLSISSSTVSNYANRASQLGLTSWPLPDSWTDAQLKQAFFNTRVVLQKNTLPDWSHVQQELKNKTVTLQLLWEEYSERFPSAYSYSHYCRCYKRWLKTQKLSMRQTHKAGEKLFVDYCGPTIAVTSPKTGEVRQAQVFVAVMGASNYTFAEATWSQGLEDWVMSHARCFDFLGGVPEMVIPDNLKSGVSKACRYEPDLNPTYHQLATHYQTVVVPARPYKPKDKSKAEVGVQIVERWIMARLRKETFYSLASLNQRIKEHLKQLNERPMKKHPGSRKEQFERWDKPALKSLPVHAYRYTQIKTVKVHIDYHVEIDKHYYSVPYGYVAKKLEARVQGEQISLFDSSECIATHPRSYRIGQHTTCDSHMPKAHQQHARWSPERFVRWAKTIGPFTRQCVQQRLAMKKHPEQSYRTCLGLLSLSKQFGSDRLEAACERALKSGLTKLKSIRNILESGLDKQPLITESKDTLSDIQHHNIRGQHYYH